MEISKDSADKNERNFSYYNYLGNYILKISELHKKFCQKIEESVLIPYAEFAQNVKHANNETLEKVRQVLSNLEQNKMVLRKNQENFYKLAKNAEKSQENFEKLALDDKKNEEQIQKAQDKMIKLKMEAQEAADHYRKQIAATNVYWKQLYQEYKPIFEIYDDNEESRCIYTRNIIATMIKNFNSLYVKDDKLLEDPEEKFKDIDSKLTAKTNTFQMLTQGNLDEILKEQPLEEYLSYEAKKKTEELAMMKTIESEEYSVIYAPGEKDLQYLIDYCKKFLPKDLSRSTSISSDTDSTNVSVVSEESKDSDKKNLESLAEESKESEAKVWEILANPANRKFLLEHLFKFKDPISNTHDVKLSAKSFDQLIQLLMQLLEKMVQENDYENITNFLPLITKYYTRRENQDEFLYSTFRRLNVWRDVHIWENIMKVIYDKKYNESESPKKKAPVEKPQGPLVNKLINFGMKKITGIIENIKGNEKVPDKDLYIIVLTELSFYLGRLTKNLLVSSEILIELAKDVIQDKREIKQLLTIQKSEIDEIFKTRIAQVPFNKKRKAQEKWGKYYHIYLALNYLEPKDLVKILCLDHATRKMFRKRIYRTIFNNFGNQLTNKQRAQIWCNILEVNKFHVNYRDFAEKFAKSIGEKGVKQIEEVINIDVQRSFNIHENCDQEVNKDIPKK